MNLRELLMNSGMDEAAADKILAEMKTNKIYTAQEENLDVRYSKLKGDHDGKLAELDKANGLIGELQNATKGNDSLQAKITDYEKQLNDLKLENEKIKLEAEVKVGLLAEKAGDIDYLTFKLRENGELALDENGKIKGWDNLVTGLKTKFPTQFPSATAEEKKIEENKLPAAETKETQPQSLAEAIKMQYETPTV